MTSFVVLSAELDACLTDCVKGVHGNVVELVVRGLGRVGGAQLRNSLSMGGGDERVGGGLGVWRVGGRMGRGDSEWEKDVEEIKARWLARRRGQVKSKSHKFDLVLDSSLLSWT